MNSRMKSYYLDLKFDGTNLNIQLHNIATSGFKRIDDCFFLNKCLGFDTNASFSDFQDKTGYECFINSVNIDDYVEGALLEQSVLFVREVCHQWNKFILNKTLVSILSLDEMGVNVKFHVRRVGEQWLSDDLEDFDECILIFESSEVS